jgi:cold shock protein
VRSAALDERSGFLLRWSPRGRKAGSRDMARGTVKWFNDDKGYGFKSFEEDAKVTYEATQRRKGMQADNVSVV